MPPSESARHTESAASEGPSSPSHREVERRPASGSCARCRGSLGLASVRVGDTWYCSTACAEGRPTARERGAAVPESWLYNRPRRFFCPRAPKELRRTPA